MSTRRIDAAALVTALAGDDGASLAPAFAEPSRARFAASLRALRADGPRPDRARALAAAGLRLLAPPRDPPPSDRVGARFVAAWVRSLDAADREPAVRRLGADATSAVRAALPSAPRLDAAGRSTATWLVRHAVAAAGRPLTLTEWSSLLAALAVRAPLADPALLRVERALRMGDRAEACASLAATVCDP